MHRIVVVIVNYKTPDLVVQCLETLDAELARGRDAAVVVDNASGDGSIDTIEDCVTRNGWGDWVRIVRASVNAGFSAGNNLGIQSARAEAYLLLNSDTLVRPGAVETLWQALMDMPEAGLVAPRLTWEDGEPQISAFRCPTPLTEFVHAAGTGPISQLLERHTVAMPLQDAPHDAGWTSFACVLIRAGVIEDAGLMDEGYFLYYEDIDYCRKATAKGWRIVYCPGATVVHLRGGSGPVKALARARKLRPRYFYESRARYYTTFYGRGGLVMANLAWMLGRGIAWTRETFGRKEPHTAPGEWKAIWTRGRAFVTTQEHGA